MQAQDSSSACVLAELGDAWPWFLSSDGGKGNVHHAVAAKVSLIIVSKYPQILRGCYLKVHSSPVLKLANKKVWNESKWYEQASSCRSFSLGNSRVSQVPAWTATARLAQLPWRCFPEGMTGRWRCGKVENRMADQSTNIRNTGFCRCFCGFSMGPNAQTKEQNFLSSARINEKWLLPKGVALALEDP